MNLNENELFSFLLKDRTESYVTSLIVTLAGLLENEPLRWKLQMLLTIKSNNPFEAFRAAGSHVFQTKDDPVVLALLQCATELIEHNIPRLHFDLPSPNPVRLTLSPLFPVPAVQIAPVAPKLTKSVKTVLRNHILKHGKLTGQEALGYALKYQVQIVDIKVYCDYTSEKITRNVLKQLGQAINPVV